MVEPALFGPLDGLLAPVIEYVLLVLVLANLGTRLVAHQSHVHQADSGAEAISRHTLHEVSNVVLVLGSFYYLTVHHHSGLVLSVLVLGMVITDFFEFESRKVEAREDRSLDTPKGAIFASVIVATYTLYVSLFFIIAPVWNAIV